MGEGAFGAPGMAFSDSFREKVAFLTAGGATKWEMRLYPFSWHHLALLPMLGLEAVWAVRGWLRPRELFSVLQHWSRKPGLSSYQPLWGPDAVSKAGVGREASICGPQGVPLLSRVALAPSECVTSDWRSF